MQEKLYKIDLTNLFSPNHSKKNDKIIYKYFKDKYCRRSKSKETRYLIDEMAHNDLMSERCKKTYNYSNYVETLLILSSAVTDCVSISAFAS